MQKIRLSVITVLMTLLVSQTSFGATIIVDSVSDVDGAGGGCTIREAILAMNERANHNDCIASGLYTDASDSIIFDIIGPDQLVIEFSALPVIISPVPLTIDGGGAATIEARLLYVVLAAAAGTDLTLVGLTIKEGKGINSDGGGVLSSGKLTVDNCTFVDNVSEGNGAAIASADLLLGNSVLIVRNSTFIGNEAVSGGAIASTGITTITNSTFSGNIATGASGTDNGGGAIANIDPGQITITNSTFINNSATVGLGGTIFQDSTEALSIANSIIAGNDVLPRCAVTTALSAPSITDNGGNLSDDASCNFVVLGTSEPNVADLQNTLGLPASNGGFTQTFAVLAASRAIEFGTTACPSLDQRGVIRPDAGACTSGAYQYNPLVITASDATMIYGGAPPSITPLYVGFINGNNAQSLAIQPTCTTTATNLSTVVGNETTSCTGAFDPNYVISYVEGAVTVNRAPLTITPLIAQTTYGSEPPVITPIYRGFVNREDPSVLDILPTCETEATFLTLAGTRALTSCSGAEAANYQMNYRTNTLTVNPAQSITSILAQEPNPVIVNSPLLVVVEVVGASTLPGTLFPTGEVMVTAGSGESCVVSSLRRGIGSCVLVIRSVQSDPPATISAQYLGDTNFLGSVSSVPAKTQTVNNGCDSVGVARGFGAFHQLLIVAIAFLGLRLRRRQVN